MAKIATTKVEMLASISGSRDGADWPRRGETIDLPSAEAADMIRAGLARAVSGSVPAPVERAVAPKGETRKGGLTKASTGL